MSVYKPAKSRFYQYDFQYKGRRFHGSTGSETLRQAEAVERKVRNDAALGVLDAPAADSYTLDEAIGRWWDEVGIHRGDAAKLKPRITALLTLFKKGVQLAQIDQAMVAEAIERRRGRRYAKSKAKDAKTYAVANATVNRDVIDSLRPILKRARTHWGAKTISDHNIDWRELRMSEPRELVRYYSAAERKAWMGECDAHAALALDLMLTYGLRFGELFFAPACFKIDGATSRLVWNKGRKHGVPHSAQLLPRHGREIAARLSRAVAAGLDHMWFKEVVDKTKKRRAGPAKMVLKPITYGSMEYRLSSAADRAGIAGGRRIHSGRHHAGTMFLKQGAAGNLKLTQRHLGHADIKSTSRYAHALDDDVFAAMIAMDEAQAEGMAKVEVAAPAAGKKRKGKAA